MKTLAIFLLSIALFMAALAQTSTPAAEGPRRRPIHGQVHPVSQNYNNAGTSKSNGIDVARSFRNAYYTTAETSDFVICFTNAGYTSALVQQGPGNSVTLTTALEYHGVSVPATFNAATSISVPNGSEACSDVIATTIPANTEFFIRHALAVSSGNFFPLGYGGGAGSSYTNGSDVTTSTGAMATGGAGAAVSQVSGIYGSTYPQASPSVLIIGDSIAAGTGDNVYPRATETDAVGFVLRGLSATSSSQAAPYSFVFTPVPGSTLAQRLDPTNAPSLYSVLSGCTYAISEVGTNDLGNATASIQANYLALWTMLARRGCQVWQTTLLPRTASTDGWRTVVSQTRTAIEAQRIIFNNWIRTAPAPLSGYIETADVVECDSSNLPTRNGGYWCTPNSTAGTGTSTGSNSSRTLNDSTRNWTANQWINYSVVVTGGTGIGQTALIFSNTATALTVSGWAPVTPDATSTYAVVETPTNDGVHPNPANHIAMGNVISSWVSAVVMER